MENEQEIKTPSGDAWKYIFSILSKKPCVTLGPSSLTLKYPACSSDRKHLYRYSIVHLLDKVHTVYLSWMSAPVLCPTWTQRRTGYGSKHFGGEWMYVYTWLSPFPVHVELPQHFWSAMLFLVAQPCLTLCNPMDCSPLGSSVHGDSPGKNTGVACHALLQGIFPTRRLNPGLPYCRQILLLSEPLGKPRNTGVGSLSLLQGIFLTQESNQGLLNCRQILYQLNYQGSP